MDILIVGSGGREHVLAWKIKQSPLVGKIYCAPGNGGMEGLAECIDIKTMDIEALARFVKEKQIGLTVVGPEAPLVAGIVDFFEKEGLKVFGPNKMAAQLEGSKAFAKEFMYENGIPTSPFIIFSNSKDAKAFLPQAEYPLVIKADGLAAGKGVFICDDFNSAEQAISQIMDEKIFKEAGEKIIVEQLLQGQEVSILAFSDGKKYFLLDCARDHKRIFDDDMGPNTGGMGAYSPTQIVDRFMLKEIEATIIGPVIRGMSREYSPFKGVLYAGLMITGGGPSVLEFNVRFGDPEIQSILPRMKGDIVKVMLACCDGQLNDVQIGWDKRHCVCVVMSSGGYPGKYETGIEIKGLDEAGKEPDTIVFHAGTKKQGGKIVTSGGRVLGVTSLGAGIETAINNAYRAVEKIKFDHCFFRRDIGAKALLKKANV